MAKTAFPQSTYPPGIRKPNLVWVNFLLDTFTIARTSDGAMNGGRYCKKLFTEVECKRPLQPRNTQFPFQENYKRKEKEETGNKMVLSM